jgi:hypothetical protein
MIEAKHTSHSGAKGSGSGVCQGWHSDIPFGTGSVNVRLKCISSDQLIFNCSVRTPFPFIRRAQSTASAAPAHQHLFRIESAQRTRAPVRPRIDNAHLPSCRTTPMGHRGCTCARSNGYHVKLFGHAFITSTSRLLPQRCIQSSTLASS